ncbi:hypothetical protein DEAC_c24960 [Desulfosporosinus acididurans]|uniref:Uncharacterized protein n=1 Tax=Desulfosporosinus acididurans TaxID=476652 RepID=A0A0J1FPC9_9FIRM|nr:hypothetical protein [Desulfosporosinus acididurans]KLU65359.1 hypothetical protein DEAC_c24960 [Desulfosporosinus acididurans]
MKSIETWYSKPIGIQKVVLILFIIGILLLGLLSTHTILTRGSSSRISSATAKETIKHTYSSASWYPLIKDIQVDGETVTILTYIYPDTEGKQLAENISRKMLAENNFLSKVEIYGLNVNKILLFSLNK